VDFAIKVVNRALQFAYLPILIFKLLCQALLLSFQRFNIF